MKTRIVSIFVIILILLIAIATITNPAKELHVQYITDKLQLYEKNKNSDSIKGLMEELMIDTFTSFEVDYHNFYIFSYANYKPTSKTDVVTVGLFNTVFIFE